MIWERLRIIWDEIIQQGAFTLARSKYLNALVTELGHSESADCKVPCNTLEDLSSSGDEVSSEFFPYR